MTLSSHQLPAVLETAYLTKDARYFAGARRDYVDQFPRDPSARILEIGCGNGDTGAYALANARCGCYCGVEICEPAATIARRQISEVILGDVERVAMPWPPDHFDGLILSEVLEHLIDPWKTLRRLRPLLRHGALVFASSPNVCHYSVIRMLVSGDWRLDEKGIMDRTHVRWFTFRTYREMFESAGYDVDQVGPLADPGPRGRFVNALTFGRWSHLFAQQISLRAHAPKQCN